MAGIVLQGRLHRVASRLYKLRILRRQTYTWLILLIPAAAAVCLIPRQRGLMLLNLIVLTFVTIVGLIFSRWKVAQPSALETARLVEKKRPNLNDAVITAVHAHTRSQAQPSVLNEVVMREADHLAIRDDWRSVVPRRHVFVWSALSFLTFCLMVSSVVAASRWGRDFVRLSVPEFASHLPANDTPASLGDFELQVEPGDTEIERGSALTVIARFRNAAPTHATLELTTADGTEHFVMDSTVDEGIFGTRIPFINADATYRVLYSNQPVDVVNVDSEATAASDTYTIETYVLPRVEQVDALITPPAYTKRQPQLIEDTLKITAVEGSDVELRVHLNKAAAIAELRTDDNILPLVPQPSDLDNAATNPPNAEDSPDTVTLTASIRATEDRRLEIHVEDIDGRTLREPVIVSLKVTRNKRPNLKVTFPGRDSNVSPLQEFHIEAQADDDFGFTDFGVMYSLSGSTSEELSLVKEDNVPDTGQLTIQHMIDLEQLNAEPDQLLTYSFYVEDAAADGSPRRTYSDMMFAEVRRFEEIFRESQQQNQNQQQQQQQQQQQGSPTDELLKLQREITVATWNTRRNLDEARATDAAIRTASSDIEVILESQQVALQQLAEVQQEAASDEQLTELAAVVQKHMEAVIEAFDTTTEDAAKASGKLSEQLTSALSSEQSAIAGLMRMRAREHEVQRSQQQQGQGQGQQNSASQQQMRQLELKNDRERYESERQAQEQQEQSAEQREQLQILSRLKELARRQQMLNDRLKQLESELRAAETEKEREEIERELKRLRDEQREMLRDVDELRQTMDQQSAQQQQQNQQTRNQVEQAREQVQQASRALDEGKLSEAIAEGTRAERQFDELQEQFRQQTSNQFSEAMRDLRQQARDMMERQDEIARELSNDSQKESQANDGPSSLRSDRNREGLEQKVAQQRDDLERVLDQAKQIVEQAEDSEPLLSNRLFETINNTREERPDEALQAAEILIGRGLFDQGQQAEQIARKGLDELSKGIEKAADAVLGSEAESLRRAQREIEDLTDQLSSEIADATGQETANGEPQTTDQNAGQQPSDGRNPGEDQTANQNGERQGSEGDENPAGGSQRRGIQRVPSPQPDQSPRHGSSASSDQQDGTAEGDERQPRDSGEQNDRQPGDRESQNSAQERGEQQDSQQPQTGRQADGQPGEEGGEGREPGEEPQSGNGQPSDSQSQQNGQQPGQQPGQSNSEQQGQGQPSPGQQAGQQGEGGGQSQAGSQQQGGSSQQGGSQQQGSPQQGGSSPRGGQQQSQQSQQPSNFLMGGGRESNNGGRGKNEGRPLTGDDYRDWSNRMREVEETLDDQDLRNRVAQVRDRARSIRAEFRRHGTEPKWDLVQSELLDEMVDLQRRIAQELSKLDNNRSMAPIDREPVPEQFDELVRRYYELLGQSRSEDQ